MNIRINLLFAVLGMALLLTGCARPASEAAKTVGLTEREAAVARP